MRKFLLLAGLFPLCLTALSQFKKGDHMVGVSVGSLFFNSGSSEYTYTTASGYNTETQQFGLQLQPSYGWFMSEKTVLGLSLNVQPTNRKDRYKTGGTTYREDNVSTFSLGLGGFARNYFSTSGNMMPYGQAGINFGTSSQSTDGFSYVGSGATAYKDTYDGKASGGFFANASLQLGLTRMVGQYTGLDFFIGYGYSYSKTDSKTTTRRDLGNNGSVEETYVNEPTIKSTNHNFMAGVVFQIFLEGKKK